MAQPPTVNGPALRRLLQSRNGPVVRHLLARGLRVQNRARALVPIDTGRLRNSIMVEVVLVGGVPVVRVGTNVRYARWVHDGTGIYGPRGRPIVPVRAKFLVFKPKGSDKVVFARSVRGQRGVPYLRRALEAA